MGYLIAIDAPAGERIVEMRMLSTGEPIDLSRTYVAAGWASVNEGTEGPPIWGVVESCIRQQGPVAVERNESIIVDSG